MYAMTGVLVKCVSSIPIAEYLLLLGNDLRCLGSLELKQVLLVQLTIVFLMLKYLLLN